MDLRNEALLMLEGKGTILEVAREASRLMDEAGVAGVVIGGVAVTLHGHVRATMGVDVLVDPPLARISDLLTANGFEYDTKRREFVKQGVPVHLVRPEDAGIEKRGEAKVIDGITTASLADQIEMKLRSGTTQPLRAQDLADVIGLVRHHRLTGEFATKLDSSLRREFRKIVQLIQQERA